MSAEQREAVIRVWIMLPTGALSIVERRQIKSGDDRELVVRARRREWLDAFRDRWCPNLGASIHSDATRDYQWRSYVTRYDLGTALAQIAMELSWSNFKNATLTPEHGLADTGLRHSLHDAYAKTWGALLDAGDHTSVYDGKWNSLTGIEVCRCWGHWWPRGAEGCRDCGEPNPSYPHEGPEGVFPSAKTRKRRTASTRKRVNP